MAIDTNVSQQQDETSNEAKYAPALSACARYWLDLGRTVLIEYRKAKMAEDLYRLLRTKSDEDLAKVGLAHGTLATHVFQRLYDNDSIDRPERPHW